MKKLNPALLFSFLGIATFASLVGTVSGTLAWYAYNARATLSYSGTSVLSSIQLHIGLACSEKMPIEGETGYKTTYADFHRVMGEPETITGDSNYYYFAPMGKGLEPSVINAYLDRFGFATNELEPVTSGYFNPNDTACVFSLKEGPSTENYSGQGDAAKKNYLKLPFVFRVAREGNYAGGEELWLTDAQAAASSSNSNSNIAQAMRIYFDRKGEKYTNGFIVNPSAPNDKAGETRVGGLLDLSADGYYDFEDDATGGGTHEIIYGEWDEILTPNPTSFINDPFDASAGNPILDLNNTGNEVNKVTTFDSRHHEYTKYYDYDDLHNTAEAGQEPNGIVFKTAKYESNASAKPVRESDGTLVNPEGKVTSVCVTAGEEGNYIGRVDAYIWLEGWDFAVIDSEQQHKFDLGLTFEVNRNKVVDDSNGNNTSENNDNGGENNGGN